MRYAIGHAVVVHRQAQKFRTRKCDSVPTHRECESDAEAMCKCWFGVGKKRVFSFEDCGSESPSKAGRRRGKKKTRCQVLFAVAGCRKTQRCQVLVCARQPPQNPAQYFPPSEFPLSSVRVPLADYVWYRRHAVMVSGACKTTAYEQQGGCLASLLWYVWRSRPFEDPRSD